MLKSLKLKPLDRPKLPLLPSLGNCSEMSLPNAQAEGRGGGGCMAAHGEESIAIVDIPPDSPSLIDTVDWRVSEAGEEDLRWAGEDCREWICFDAECSV
jgi:hypothetical protein